MKIHERLDKINEELRYHRLFIKVLAGLVGFTLGLFFIWIV